MRLKESYWIWGQFSEKQHNYLNTLKNEVQNNLKSPDFNVHITLTGPYKSINKKFVNSIKLFSERQSSIDLELNSYKIKDEFYQSFYISVTLSEDLIKLRSSIYYLYPFFPQKKYSPHISLAYGNHLYKDKKNLISTMRTPINHVCMDRLSLVYVNEEKEIWNMLESFYFSKSI